MTEHTLQLICIAEFKNQYERHGNGIIIPVPNELAAKRKDITICIGCSDTILIFRDRVVFAEFKVGENYQLPSQKDFEQRITALGYEYHIIRSLTQFKEILT